MVFHISISFSIIKRLIKGWILAILGIHPTYQAIIYSQWSINSTCMNSNSSFFPLQIHFSTTIRESVCAVGFEPNPSHEAKLKGIERSYRQCGWNVRILTRTAASDKNGVGTFFSDLNFENNEWGGSILKGQSFVAIVRKDTLRIPLPILRNCVNDPEFSSGNHYIINGLFCDKQ